MLLSFRAEVSDEENRRKGFQFFKTKNQGFYEDYLRKFSVKVKKPDRFFGLIPSVIEASVLS